MSVETHSSLSLAVGHGVLRAGAGNVVGAIEKGLRFLLVHQSADGAWRDFLCYPGRSEAWTTAYIGSSVIVATRAGISVPLSCDAARSLEPAAANLLATSGTDAGWGYNQRCDTDCDTTSQVVLFLREVGRRVDLRCYARIARFQREDGGFATYQDAGCYGEWAAGHPDVTAVALRALRGILPADHGIVKRGFASLRRHMATADAGMSYWWESRNYLRRELCALGDFLPDAGRLAEAKTFEPVCGCFDEALALDARTRCPLQTAAAVSDSVLVESLVGAQRTDGSWPVQPILRIPERKLSGENISFSRASVCVTDDRRLFTTATVLRALAVWIRA